MEKKGFFKPPKRGFIFSVVSLVLSVVMFMPPLYNGTTAATGTSYIYIMGEVMIILAASLSMLEGILTKSGDGEEK